ncbi:MAG TPA: hypothetical protein VGM94_17275 [Galbitalea sp.]
MEGRRIDYTSLTEPVTRRKVIAFRHSAAKTSAFGPRLTPVQAMVAVAITVGVTIGVLFLFMPVFWPVMQESPTMFWLVGAIPLAVFIAVAIVCIVVLARAFGTYQAWERWMRLDAFARANSLDFHWQTEYPDLPGYLFDQGADEVSHDVLTGHDFQLGEFSYLARGATRLRRKHRWGYIGVQIPHRVPHVILRAHATERSLGGMTLPRLPHILSLESDFTRYFSTEYAGAPQDVLEFLTPSVMASLIDEASGYQVEAVEGWLFFYIPGRIMMDNAVTIQRMLRLVDVSERVS